MEVNFTNREDACLLTDFESKKSNPDFPKIHDIIAEELVKKLDGTLLIDVRQPDEFTGELGHIEGAQLIPLGTLATRLEEFPRDKTIVFVCRSGGRSLRAAAFALESGLEHVYNLKGGMLRWNDLQLPVQGR